MKYFFKTVVIYLEFQFATPEATLLPPPMKD